MNDALGAALYDYQQGERKHKLWIYNKYGPKEEMPVSTYFRDAEALSELELMALAHCRGKVLDIGAAVGCHSLLLQQKNIDVTALDASAKACAVMQQRGVKKVVNENIFNYKEQQFDTLLLLMNGIGLAATMEGLQILLQVLKTLLSADGQILFDSSNVDYLYKNKALPQHYYGEIDYQYAYRGKQCDWFKWLYIDQQTMQQMATQCGFALEVVAEDEYGQYLGRLQQL